MTPRSPMPRRCRAYPLAWIEEPVHPLDYDLHRDMAERFPSPIATGENLFSADDARNLLRYGGLRPDRDILQFDISLSYGIVEYRRILDIMSEHGWSRARCAPHAGHLLAFNVVAGLGLGCAETAIDEDGLFGKLTSAVPVADGRATLSERAGNGLRNVTGFLRDFLGRAAIAGVAHMRPRTLAGLDRTTSPRHARWEDRD